jgi:hypothetical protein
MPEQPSPRRRFQFRLRTLLLVVAIAAVICAACLPMIREWLKPAPTVKPWMDDPSATGTTAGRPTVKPYLDR